MSNQNEGLPTKWEATVCFFKTTVTIWGQSTAKDEQKSERVERIEVFKIENTEKKYLIQCYELSFLF